jgi:hypothetical protein
MKPRLSNIVFAARVAILPADQHSDEGRQRFHEIVGEAIRNAPIEGYEVTLLQKGNRGSMDWWIERSL